MRPLFLSIAIVVLAGSPAFATDNTLVKPKGLTASQFSSNCQNQGGMVTDVSSRTDRSAGNRVITCDKTNGTHVTCQVNRDGTSECAGRGPTRQ
ncbi:MAG: hypothetical protein FJX11_06265 [Alphaproteobacteria bacterium]|nr:hypothetical protein [Alphaproteobacteria bacterium]